MPPVAAPQNLEAERAVLGAVLLENRVLGEIREVLSPSDFYDSRNRVTFGAMSALSTLDIPVDLVTLRDHLRSNKSLTAAGGPEYIPRLVAEVPTAEGAVHYAKMIRDLAGQREDIEFFSNLAAERGNGLDDGELLSLLQEQVDRVRNRGTAEDIIAALPSMGAFIERYAEADIPWAVAGVIPEGAITLLPGPGGAGKSWVALTIATAVSGGLPWLGRPTRKNPVYLLDYENPAPILARRARAVGARGVVVWHSSHNPPPPRLDDARSVEILTKLPAGSLVVIDNLRTAHQGDENDSRQMAIVMGNVRRIRDARITTLLLHHNRRGVPGEPGAYRGSSVIVDGADHVVAMERVGEAGTEVGTIRLKSDKTRYGTCDLALGFNFRTGEISKAQTPEDEQLDELAGVIEYLAANNQSCTQKEVVALGKDELDVGRAAVLALLRKGENRGRWQASQEFRRGPKYYTLTP